jgi:chloramphenicol O-acetyltransferase type A
LGDAVSAPRRVVHDYYRREHLEFFARYRSPFYAVSFDLDATALKAELDRERLPIYLNFVWTMTAALQAVEDFRYRCEEGQVVLYEQLHPGLTVPAPGGRFSFCALEFHPDRGEFNRRAAPRLAEASAGVDLGGGKGAEFVYFTALPKVPFTAFTHVAPDDPLAGQPRVAFGRFARRDGRLWVPVALLVNHVYIDGVALGRLYEEAERGFGAADATGIG